MCGITGHSSLFKWRRGVKPLSLITATAEEPTANERNLSGARETKRQINTKAGGRKGTGVELDGVRCGWDESHWRRVREEEQSEEEEEEEEWPRGVGGVERHGEAGEQKEVDSAAE